MDILADPPDFAGFHQIRSAFEIARELPQWRARPIRVGVRRTDGELVAAGVLNDDRQARLFSIQMTSLGYRQVDGDEAAEDGCEFVFVPDSWSATRVDGSLSA